MRQTHLVTQIEAVPGAAAYMAHPFRSSPPLPLIRAAGLVSSTVLGGGGHCSRPCVRYLTSQGW